jgi:hypothetical protein
MTASIRALLSGLSSTSGNRTRGDIMFNVAARSEHRGTAALGPEPEI